MLNPSTAVKVLSYSYILARQTDAKPKPEIPSDKVGLISGAVKYLADNGLGSLLFHFVEKNITISGKDCPSYFAGEKVGQDPHGKPDHKSIGGAVYALYTAVISGKMRPDSISNQINVQESLASLAGEINTDAFIARFLATVSHPSKDPKEILRVKTNRGTAVAEHKPFQDPLRNQKAAKSGTVKSTAQEKEAPAVRIAQLDKLVAPLLQGEIENPGVVAKQGNIELQTLQGAA